MKTFDEVKERVVIHKGCPSKEHFLDLIIDGKCAVCETDLSALSSGLSEAEVNGMYKKGETETTYVNAN